ncbi:phytanoyl-CoA dioxygenase family protein [Anabaena sp. UHCC 0451]|uniref:phytanoyl-CoA dioxygenase family protein n=1 Tax=Anabaena sp. UHCC 0451 TaxID=2055235 RepID=UPI002B2057A6|nr:phytanoyl-CoA dioxygenase family protein [Anabaena sp. UHCC 0451]MEA5579053.1 phytanoyl-CoA dioxygenase family protein [Anabaena sp. UHCC 0451]
MNILNVLRSDFDCFTNIKSSLEDDGFFIKRQAISETTMSAIRESLANLIRPESKKDESIFDTITRLHLEGDGILYRLHTLSTNLTVMNTLREECARWVELILGSDHPIIDVNSHIIFSIPNDTRSMWSWHQESTYDFLEEATGLNFCVPIFEQASQENGTMSILRGSHKLGKLPFEKQIALNGSTTLLPKGMETILADYEEIHFIADPGDMIGFHRDIVHRSNTNSSTRPRITAVVQFAVIDRIPDSLEKPY